MISNYFQRLQFPGKSEEPYFEGEPYEWWVEGGKKKIEAGQLVGVVRGVHLNPDQTIYTLKHSYNADGEIPLLLNLFL